MKSRIDNITGSQSKVILFFIIPIFTLLISLAIKFAVENERKNNTLLKSETVEKNKVDEWQKGFNAGYHYCLDSIKYSK
jgi:hypothetical protein